MTDNKLDIVKIQKEDGDWLTDILEPYADELYDEIRRRESGQGMAYSKGGIAGLLKWP